ncbi:hypothetical protein PALB_11940 [Pseudoalteromonas luteoviolacea B = ATCC 29581]|nr:hypothetical protein PALB_11940 [Pseudoalteromonas luteoviolacea B = ATCC 29581]
MFSPLLPEKTRQKLKEAIKAIKHNGVLEQISNKDQLN